MQQTTWRGFPRLSLGHWPTPLEDLPRLSRLLEGPRILVKRDDCSGLAIGGNKVRKLEFLLADAIEQGADTIVTLGGLQSNHARQTAAACARLGLQCELVLPRLVPRDDSLYETNGNVLIDDLCGATRHIVSDEAEAAQFVSRLLAEIEDGGGRAVLIPAGGSTEIGALGYAAAAEELLAQCDKAAISPTRILLAAGTCGTLGGLLAGLAHCQREIPVTAIAVLEAATASTTKADDLARVCAQKLDVPQPAPADVRDGYRGSGYGIPTEKMREALQLCARQEGLLLDPVYTGKAMAGLIDMIREGEIRDEECVIFWHTGGTPGLFAYASDL